jgi:hypothetical protein
MSGAYELSLETQSRCADSLADSWVEGLKGLEPSLPAALCYTSEACEYAWSAESFCTPQTFLVD